MIPFKQITKADTKTIAYFFDGPERRRALLACKHYQEEGSDDICMAIVDGMLVFRQEITQQYVYSMPVGNGNLRLVLLQMMEDAARMNYDWMLCGVHAGDRARLMRALPQHFEFGSEEKFSFLDILIFFRWVNEEATYVALPTQTYMQSIFYSNEQMVPTIGEFGNFG